MVLQRLNLFEIDIFEDRKVTERRAEPLFVDLRFQSSYMLRMLVIDWHNGSRQVLCYYSKSVYLLYGNIRARGY